MAMGFPKGRKEQMHTGNITEVLAHGRPHGIKLEAVVVYGADRVKAQPLPFRSCSSRRQEVGCDGSTARHFLRKFPDKQQ
jgi:hypothetical protein